MYKQKEEEEGEEEEEEEEEEEQEEEKEGTQVPSAFTKPPLSTEHYIYTFPVLRRLHAILATVIINQPGPQAPGHILLVLLRLSKTSANLKGVEVKSYQTLTYQSKRAQSSSDGCGSPGVVASGGVGSTGGNNEPAGNNKESKQDYRYLLQPYMSRGFHKSYLHSKQTDHSKGALT